VRSSFFAGCTSSRAGSPALPATHFALGFGSGAGFGGAVATGAALAVALAAGGSSPSRFTSEYDRDRVAVAEHVESLITHWYCAVSLSEIDVSLAWIRVTTAT
jgi:hypothetical protein